MAPASPNNRFGGVTCKTGSKNQRVGHNLPNGFAGGLKKRFGRQFDEAATVGVGLFAEAASGIIERNLIPAANGLSPGSREIFYGAIPLL